MFEHLEVWTNGRLIPWREATVPILSHALSRGSAIFEVFGIHPGPGGSYAFRMDRHLDRLFRTASLLGMELGVSRAELEDAVAETVRENGVSRGLIKIIACWSEEAVISLVLDAKLDVTVCAIPAFDDLSLDQAKPVDACVSRWRKIAPDMIPCEAKACANYLSGYLARKDAVDRGYDLGILLTGDGQVGEGSIESVFVVRDGVLMTPPLGNVLASVTRASILEAAPTYGITVSQTPITVDALLSADEIFTCHTGIKVLPVKRIEDRHLSPVPGPVTVRAMEMMRSILTMEDDRFASWFQPMFA